MHTDRSQRGAVLLIDGLQGEKRVTLRAHWVHGRRSRAELRRKGWLLLCHWVLAWGKLLYVSPELLHHSGGFGLLLSQTYRVGCNSGQGT